MTEPGPSITGLRALVIGASAGIGREVGLRLAASGVVVAFHGRRRDRLDEAVSRAGSGHAVVADLASASACADVIAEAAHHLGGIDMIVFAASSSRLSMLRDTEPEAWAEIFATNVIAPALVVRAALAHLSPGAICAFISSESVGMPYHGLVPYGASKAALEEVVRGQRLEHPELRFSCIRVGQTMPTDFGRDFDPVLAGDLFPKWIAHGRLPAQSMEVVELGTTIAEILMSAMVSPSVELQDVILRAPGGVFTGGIDSMLESIDVAHTTGSSG